MLDGNPLGKAVKANVESTNKKDVKVSAEKAVNGVSATEKVGKSLNEGREKSVDVPN